MLLRRVQRRSVIRDGLVSWLVGWLVGWLLLLLVGWCCWLAGWLVLLVGWCCWLVGVCVGWPFKACCLESLLGVGLLQVGRLQARAGIGGQSHFFLQRQLLLFTAGVQCSLLWRRPGSHHHHRCRRRHRRCHRHLRQQRRSLSR